LPADGFFAEPPLSPAPFAGFVGTPRRTAPASRGPALPGAISGPPARAVSGPPARIAAPTGSNLPFPGAGSDRPRTLVPATIVSAAPPVPRRARSMVAFIGALFAVLVLGIGGYFWALPVYGQTHATVVAPDDLIGLPRLSDAGSYARFAAATTELKKLGIDNPLMVGYMASDDPAHLVVVAGAPHPVWLSVGRDLDRLLAALAKNPDTAVQSPGLADPGQLGGVARCGTVRGRNQLSVCGWQDHGTIGLLFFNNRTPAEAAVLMRAMRPALEHRTG